MKKIISIAIALVLCFAVAVSAVGLLKPTMQITAKSGVYTIEVSGLTRTQSNDLEKIIDCYLKSLEKDDCGSSKNEAYNEVKAIVYLVRNNKLYHIENGQEKYIDTIAKGEIGVDKYNNVVYIDDSNIARYIYNTNDYPTSIKKVISSAKNLDKNGNVVTGVDYASGNYTKTITSFIKDSGNDIPVVIYEQSGSNLRVLKLGEYVRVTSSISKNANNPIAVTEEGNIVYVTISGYVYEIEDVENLTKITSTTPTRIDTKNVKDIEIYDGTATEYVLKNGKREEID